jgi:succinate dehydrogenase / fumarate reductase cytochrome b subunit
MRDGRARRAAPALSRERESDVSAVRQAQPRGRKSFYRGGEGMLTWVLHRVSGVALFGFLFVHVLDTSLVVVSPGLYNGVIELYHAPIVKLMEMGLVGAVLYHGLNGLRITLVDFWSKGAARNKMMMRVQTVVFVVLLLGALIPMTAQLIDEIQRNGII